MVVVLAPYLTWSDISAEKTPAIWSLLDDAAIGNMNAHTADEGWPTFAGGVLTLSASRWAKAPKGGPIDAASLDRARAENATSLAKPVLGSLGTAVLVAGGSTIAVGASDTDTRSPAGRLRPAELLATDESGTLCASYADVLRPDPAAPFGLRTDAAKLSSAIASALAEPRALVVVDVGDLSRAHDAPAPSGDYWRRHDDAVAVLDAAIAELDARLGREPGRDSLLMIAAAATDKDWYKAPELGPLIVSGAGVTGELVSPSTRRDALGVNLDVAPTVLAALGAPVPPKMLGRPLGFRSTPLSAVQLIDRLSRENAAAGVVDQMRDAWVLQWFCYAAIAAVALAALLVLLPLGRASVFGELAVVVTLSALPAGWLMFLAVAQPPSVHAAWDAFRLATLGVALVALAIRRVFSASRVALPLFLATLTALVVAVDQWTGHPIASGVFSYSVAAGWRYYGIGNEGASILVGASIAAVALGADALAEKPALARAVRRFGMPLVALVIIVTAAAPFAGANAGVAIWGVVAFGVAWAAMNGARRDWRTATLILVGVVVAVAASAALDLMNSVAGTHLARFTRDVLAGDVSATVELVRRKLENNLAFMPQTNYTGLALAMALALVLVRFAPGRPLRRALRAAPVYGCALIGIVIASVVAWASEDSGVVMPALMLFSGATPALLIALRAPRAEG